MATSLGHALFRSGTPQTDRHLGQLPENYLLPCCPRALFVPAGFLAPAAVLTIGIPPTDPTTCTDVGCLGVVLGFPSRPSDDPIDEAESDECWD